MQRFTPIFAPSCAVFAFIATVSQLQAQFLPTPAATLLRCIVRSTAICSDKIHMMTMTLQLIKEFYNTTYISRHSNFSEASMTLTWSLTTALFIPGGMIGAFLGGWLADKIGRFVVLQLLAVVVYTMLCGRIFFYKLKVGKVQNECTSHNFLSF